MSDPAPSATPNATPTSGPDPVTGKRLRLDPTVLPIVVAGVVLVGAVVWLAGRPLPPTAPAGSPLEAIAALETRLAALESGAAPRLAALEATTRRLTALEALAPRLAALESRPGPDLAPLETRLATTERLARDIAARPVLDPTALASRSALEAQTLRLDRLSDRAEGAVRQEEARAAANAARIEALARDVTGRAALLEQAQGQTAQRLGATESALAARLATLEAGLAARGATIEAQATRLAALEGTAQRLSALEGRAGRMATLDALRAGLEAGRPLGPALAALRDAPAPLTRFATEAPPTESALRLTFEDAARAGRTASEPARDGQGVLDAAVSRLSGLVTVRRGEEVLWGDAAAAEIERARRAVEAGDLEGALTRLARLSAPAKEAMRGWIGQAEALVAARATLRALAAG